MSGILIQIWNTTLVFMQPWYKSINAQDLLNAKVNKRKNNYYANSKCGFSSTKHVSSYTTAR